MVDQLHIVEELGILSAAIVLAENRSQSVNFILKQAATTIKTDFEIHVIVESVGEEFTARILELDFLFGGAVSEFCESRIAVII